MKTHKHTLRKRCTATLGRLARCAAALLLVFSMLLAVLPVLAQGEGVLAESDIPEALSRAQLEEHGAVQRLYDEEQGDNDFVFLNRDGTITRYDFSVPVKYKDETGKYRDKNNKIKDWNGEYGNTAGDVELRFPKQLNFIKIKYNGHTVRIKPVTSASAGHLPAMVQGSSVSYAGAFGEGTELRYTSAMSGIKEDIILQNSEQGNSFSFEVRTGGLELRQQNGVWGIYDGEEAVFGFGDLEVTDSFTGQDEATDDWDAHRTYAQAQVSALGGDKYLFTITVPQEYLQAESTVYPVYVDPTFNVNRSYIQDTYIAKGYTNNYVNSSLVAVGYGTNAKNVRTLAKISDLFGGQTTRGRVTAAYYSMYCTSDYSSTPTVDAYMINSSVSWNPSAVTWQNSADMLMNAADKISTLTVKGAGRYNFDITSAYQAWQTGTANNGIMLRMTTEVSGKYRQFASANVSDSSKLAYVTVTYQDVALGITISPEEAYMVVGEVKRISALAHSVNETITWSSDNPSVATVDANGNVTAHSAGDVTITATGTYGGSSATCGITVVAKGVESVTLPYRTLYLAKEGVTIVNASITPSDASIQQVTWSSSNKNVATVDNQGMIHGIAPGTAIITVRSEQGSKTDSMTVIVPEFENGTYFVQNKATGKFMDIKDRSEYGDSAINQWSVRADTKQNSLQWIFELCPDGYYKIKSMHSGMYLSVENNSSEQNAAVVQKAFNNGSGQLWKVELLSDGAYKITPKSGESSNRVLASAYYAINVNGTAVQQRLFVDDTNYKDEWILTRPRVKVEDQGYGKPWCWATAARMFAKNYCDSVTKSKESAVRFVKGALIDEGGNMEEASRAIQYYLCGKETVNTGIHSLSVYSETTLKRFIDEGHVLYIRLSYYTKISDNMYELQEIGHAVLISGYIIDNGKCYFIICDSAGAQIHLWSYDFLYSHKGVEPRQGETVDESQFTAWTGCINVQTSYSDMTVPYYFTAQAMTNNNAA